MQADNIHSFLTMAELLTVTFAVDKVVIGRVEVEMLSGNQRVRGLAGFQWKCWMSQIWVTGSI